MKKKEKILYRNFAIGIIGIIILAVILINPLAIFLEPEIKLKLTEKTGEIEFRITEGSDPFIQLQSLLASFVLAGLGK